MKKARLKTALALMLCLVALIGMLGMIRATSWVLAFFQQGVNPGTALNLEPNVALDLGVDLTWLADGPDVGRTPDPIARDLLAQAYERAWLEWNLAHARNDPAGLSTAFSGPTLARMRDLIAENAAQHVRIAQTDTSHRLRLVFYSSDGMLAALRDEQSTEARFVYDESGALLHAEQTESAYSVVLVQEDGRWLVRHLTRTALDVTQLNTPSATRLPKPGFVDSAGVGLLLDGAPYLIHGMNYYPQATPWERFWQLYQPDVIDQDFLRMRSLQLNTVRIFVPYEQFGGMQVRPDMLDRLQDLLDRAERNNLKVIVTLFDFRSDYNPLLWPQSDRHLTTILGRFRDSPAILAWDLKNEPDLDYRSQRREVVDLWLSHTLRKARAAAPHHLITIGWSSAQAAAAFEGPLDLVSFHDYLPPETLANRYAALRTAHPTVPIVLGEYGLPTWNSPLFANGHTEDEQAQYYADVLKEIRDSDAVGAVAWTMYDFDQIPATVAGRWPWQTGPQSRLGILRANGSPKPAAMLLAPDAELAVSRVPGYARFLKPFWLFWIVVGCGIVVIGWRWQQRRRQRVGA